MIFHDIPRFHGCRYPSTALPSGSGPVSRSWHCGERRLLSSDLPRREPWMSQRRRWSRPWHGRMSHVGAKALKAVICLEMAEAGSPVTHWFPRRRAESGHFYDFCRCHVYDHLLYRISEPEYSDILLTTTARSCVFQSRRTLYLASLEVLRMQRIGNVSQIVTMWQFPVAGIGLLVQLVGGYN